jgi:hypothetical protein
MKKWLISILSFYFCHISFGQDKDLSVIATAGTTYVIPGLTLDWTLGEVTVDFYDQGIVGISQGFHQPAYSLVSVQPVPESIGSIKILPNVFSDQFSIDMQFNKPVKGNMILLGLDGAIVWEKAFKGDTYQEQYSGSHLTSGAYVLIVQIPDQSITSSYQLLKIQ